MSDRTPKTDEQIIDDMERTLSELGLTEREKDILSRTAEKTGRDLLLAVGAARFVPVSKGLAAVLVHALNNEDAVEVERKNDLRR